VTRNRRKSTRHDNIVRALPTKHISLKERLQVYASCTVQDFGGHVTRSLRNRIGCSSAITAVSVGSLTDRSLFTCVDDVQGVRGLGFEFGGKWFLDGERATGRRRCNTFFLYTVSAFWIVLIATKYSFCGSKKRAYRYGQHDILTAFALRLFVLILFHARGERADEKYTSFYKWLYFF